MPATARAQIDLLTMALACDLTRVTTLAFGDYQDWPFLDVRLPGGLARRRARRARHPGVTYFDITSLKQREEELRAKTAILGATLENMDQGITMVDAHLDVIAFNRRFHRAARLAR